MRPAARVGRVSGREHTVWLGLGGNMGDRLGHLRRAVLALGLHPEIAPVRASRIYETAYVGPGRQDPYLNACLEIRTSLAPAALLGVLKGLEERHGRGPDGHMRPRPVDLDILLWRGRRVDTPRLTVPHPRLAARAFVLVPLAELAGDEIFSDSGETIRAACAKIRRKSTETVRLLRDAAGKIVPLLPDGSGLEGPTKEDWRAALAVHCR